ncbi:MAG: Mur ligase family protein [Anaeroplasma sp.]
MPIGSGVSALAKLLIDKGHIVRGVDVINHFYTENDLYSIKIESFDNMILKPSYVYIIGNAYVNHSVTKYIKLKNYKYYFYPQFISKYFNNYKFLAISGSHGKTTTTKMLAYMIPNSSYIIGDGTGSGKGNTNFIIEACEYRNTFLNYYPDISLILNIDYDHPDFFRNVDEYNLSFFKLKNQSKLVVINGDSYQLDGDNVITYGLDNKNDVIFSYEINNDEMIVKVLDSFFVLPIVGVHFAYDFVGAYLVAKLLDVEDSYIKDKIKSFKLPKRRMEEKIIKGCKCIIDYAHHPTEIDAVIKTIKEIEKNKKIVCCFQPHTISRTEAFKENFKRVLDKCDYVYLLPIFTSVRESTNIYEEKKLYDFFDYKVINTINEINFDKKNLYLFLGAGDIDNLVNDFIKTIS